MKKKEYKLNNESELDIIINDWIDDIRDVKIVLLNGELGSGKTTFVKKLAKKLGIVENITSPSFNYMKNYNSLIHIDLYNYKGDIEEFEDYFEDNIIAIEWANLFKLDYKSYILVQATLNNDQTHTFRIEKK
ncbi:tRNA (adenosine(37)-N6)-threonylcarbamoyltransferase complex ATPase subunit type 1 TsaE [Mycoplasmopsis cynos]|uniref:tRNA (adenosine(37)-N6)-threonylcarbamoyltransferase complex ATPase subunit type 1 TsaE n=1 Tax=Mycoplasmopsis cynos TaxID=171284 RepID=UPI002AFFE7E2|nr:tRNA (adenosine(37)-N6)-threonylcarbamoyltransferase complex ATPase subunit type 1 TsaE [Mycoplasmopsis cynos]WQQ16987.1 tRNA (adenosine(37)-N6)-threonylcarbamoyltransferase complex ATPase subunit type 1 TsaE [Mycoplasmopsis cynos]WQQ18635.1 tRNA (adenosine(37)-N6)-threonylcarbamoyltransferase complex ATPase subunit type 1 TsaE [Mycoplasmopsis cynos]